MSTSSAATSVITATDEATSSGSSAKMTASLPSARLAASMASLAVPFTTAERTSIAAASRPVGLSGSIWSA